MQANARRIELEEKLTMVSDREAALANQLCEVGMQLNIQQAEIMTDKQAGGTLFGRSIDIEDLVNPYAKLIYSAK